MPLNIDKILEHFEFEVERYEKHELLAARAREYSTDFSPIVITRVVDDHTARAKDARGKAMPLLRDMEVFLVDLDRERQALVTDQQRPRDDLEELELRLLIGEIDDALYENESEPLRRALALGAQRLEEIDATVQRFRRPMGHWIEICGEAP